MVLRRRRTWNNKLTEIDQSTGNIKTKDCTGCGKKIYWNVLQNQYYELATRQKHICSNPQAFQKKPTVFYKKADVTYDRDAGYISQQKVKEEKPQMSNTFELLEGSPRFVREQYQFLSDTITRVKGKVHGSQSHVDTRDGHLRMFIYFEIPVGQRESVQKEFQDYVTNRKSQRGEQ